MSHESIVDINASNFESEVLQSSQTVLVDFWASWCQPCLMLAPVLDEVAVELEGNVKIAKVNVDENSELAARFNITSIPTVLVFRDGEVVESLVGLRSKDQMIEAVRPAAVS